MGVAVGVAVGMAVGTVEMFPTAAGDFCAPESSYRRFWNGKRSEIAISSSCCKESLIHQAVRLVLKTCSPPLKTDYIQLTLTNWKVPVRLNFNYYPMIFFCCAGQSEDYMYRYRHVETDLCLTMFPALPLLPLLLYPSSSSTTIHFSLIPSPPPQNRSYFLRICWADATSPNFTNRRTSSNKCNATHTLATTLLTDNHTSKILLVQCLISRLSVAETAYKPTSSAGQFDQNMIFSMSSVSYSK